MRAPRVNYEGRTPSGRTVVVVFDPDGAPHGWAVRIDGEAAQHTATPLVLRDGGTKIFETDRGRVTTPRTAWGGTEGTLDDETLTPLAEGRTPPPVA